MPTLLTYQITGQTNLVTFYDNDIDLGQAANAVAKAIRATGVSIQPVPIFSWAPESLPTQPKYLGMVMFTGLPQTENNPGVALADAYELRHNPKNALLSLVQTTRIQLTFDPNTWVYVDPDDLVPANLDPVGDPWPDNWLVSTSNPPRKVYHTGAGFSLDKYPLGTIDKPTALNRIDGHYTLFGWWEGSSAGLPGQSAQGGMRYAWEKDYSK